MIIRKCSECEVTLGVTEIEDEGIKISHGLCNECLIKLYPDHAPKIIAKNGKRRRPVEHILNPELS